MAMARGRGTGARGRASIRAPSRGCEPGAPDADRDHEQRRDEIQPGVEILGHDELGKSERDEAEREDADRVRHRHDQAQQQRVPGLPRVPTRYAATIAFPCPGVRACAAPQKSASRARGSRRGSARPRCQRGSRSPLEVAAGALSARPRTALATPRRLPPSERRAGRPSRRAGSSRPSGRRAAPG